LIVEDEEFQLLGNQSDLHSISREKSEKLGIASFDVDLARALDEAEQLLSKANGLPYDLMLMDLCIPVTRNQPNSDRPENGQQLLAALEKGLVKEIIVTSMFTEFDRVASSFRNGALDYLGKPYRTVQLQTVVLKCWQRLLLNKSTLILGERRMSELVQCAERSLASGFESCFVSLLKDIAANSEDLEVFMRERYGLDRQQDSNDSLFAFLKSYEKLATKAKVQWKDLQSPMVQEGEKLDVQPVQKVLEEIHESIAPCLVVKNATLNVEGENLEILTFGHSVRWILKEIILGALATLPDYNDHERVIDIKIEIDIGQAKVTLKDGSSPISTEDAKEINEGILSRRLPLWFQLERGIDRVWGLSVMQQLALRGAGRLEIRPYAHGNVITYFIPAA